MSDTESNQQTVTINSMEITESGQIKPLDVQKTQPGQELTCPPYSQGKITVSLGQKHDITRHL